MADPAYKLLSGSTNGKPVLIAATATPGTTVHTAVTGTTSVDIIRLVAHNLDSSSRLVTVEWGGVTDPDHLVAKTVNIPANSSVPIVVDYPLNNALLVKVFASVTNVVTVTGEVRNITL